MVLIGNLLAQDLVQGAQSEVQAGASPFAADDTPDNRNRGRTPAQRRDRPFYIVALSAFHTCALFVKQNKWCNASVTVNPGWLAGTAA